MATKTTQLALKYLKGHGYLVAVVEHWNAWAKIRQDLFGCIDIIGLHPKRNGVLGVQVTSWDGVSSRLAKIKAIPAMRVWLQAQNSLWVMGWKKGVKEPKVRVVTLEDFEP